MTTATALGTQAAVRFKDPNNRVISAAQWLEYCNQAYKNAATSSPLLPWNQSAEQTVSVTAATRSGNLPANVFTVNWVYDATNDRPLLDIATQGQQWNSDMLRTDSGAPLFYRIRNTVIELFPLPDQTISLRMECVTYPAVLAGGDSPVFPAAFHEDLIDGMIALAYLDDGNDAQYMARWKMFTAKIANMNQNVLMARSQRNPGITDDFFG